MRWRRAWVMRRVHKTRITYCVQWLDDSGRRRTEAVGPDKRLAEAVRKRREMEINNGKYRETVSIRLREFAAEHVRLIDGAVSEKTAKEHAEVLEMLERFCGNVLLEKITPKTAEALFAARRTSVRPATANKTLRTLKGIFEAAVRRGYLRRNPFRDIKPAHEPERPIRVLSADEIARLLSACPDLRWRCFVSLALAAGLRLGEMVHLEWSDVDFENGLIYVRCKEGHRTKSGRNRIVPLVPELARMLKHLRSETGDGYVFRRSAGTPWRNNVHRKFRSIVRKAGIGHCTIHDLRKTFCSQLASAGENEAVIQRLAGHASITTTLKHYTAVLPETIRRAPERLPYVQGFSIVA